METETVTDPSVMPSDRHHLPPVGDRTYENPVGYVDGVRRTDPDPFILRDRGRYWCYSTDEHHVNVSVSDDLVHWVRLEPAFRVEGRHHYWAPCVVRIAGRYWMYVSNRPVDSDDPHDELLHVAVADEPQGPFTVVRRMFDEFSLDADVVRTRDGGAVLFSSRNVVEGAVDGRIGTIIDVDRLVGTDRVAGEPRVIVRPSIDEEIYERDRFGDGRDWHTIEGAAYFTHLDRAFLTYSGNAYVREDYFIGYATAPLTGDPDELDWRKHPADDAYDPLVRRNDRVEGTGHNSITTAPNLVDTWIVYHGRDSAEALLPDVEQREMRIDPIHFSGARLLTVAPSSLPQDAPALPGLRDLFDGADDPGWVAETGGWTRGDRLATTRADGATRMIAGEPTDASVTEVDVRLHAGTAWAGVVAAAIDGLGRIEVRLGSDGAIAAILARDGVVDEVLERAALVQFNAESWSLLRIRRGGERLEVAVDGVPVLDLAIPGEPGAVGLTASGAAEFSGFARTDHLELVGDGLRRLPRWLRVDAAAAFTERGIGAPDGSAIVTGPRPADVVTTHALEFDAPDAAVELEPWAADGRRIRILVSPTASLVELLDGEHALHRFEDDRKEPRPGTTIRTLLSADRGVIQIDDVTIPLTLGAPHGRGEQRLVLSNSWLRSYEQTSLSIHPAP